MLDNIQKLGKGLAVSTALAGAGVVAMPSQALADVCCCFYNEYFDTWICCCAQYCCEGGSNWCAWDCC